MFRAFTMNLVAALAVAVAMPAFGKTITKNARSNDVASSYILEDNGNFFRMVRGNKCQITNNVLDFKVSQHPQDAAVIYYVRDESTPTLYVLHNAERTGQCPKASKKAIMENLDKQRGEFRYNVVSNTNTTIVNTALNSRGDFLAWDNTSVVLSARNVEDYTMHGKFGVSGAPFSSYVLFLINDRGFVLKVKGLNPASSKWDESRRYNSLSEFKKANNIQ